MENYEWLKEIKTAWTYGSILTPVEIQIISLDFENQRAEIKTKNQQGYLPFDRIYKTSEECDFL